MKKIFKKFVQYYLWLLTKVVLWRYKPEIIAIGGTVNKTLVKEAVRDIFPAGEKARANPKSYNTEIGLPLAVLYLPSGQSDFFRWLKILAKGTVSALFGRDFPSKLILELGVDRPRDMDYLLTLVSPRVVVITDISPVNYLDNFQSLENIALEYGKLLAKMPDGGTAVLNYDSLRVRELSKFNPKLKYLSYGLEEGADIRAVGLMEGADAWQFQISYGGRLGEVQISHPGRRHIYAALAAFATGVIYGK